MCKKEEFRRRVGVVDVDAIKARSPNRSWGWWKSGPNLLCFGKTDWDCAIGIIYQHVQDGAFEMFGCWAPSIPPVDDNCIIFTNKDGDYIDDQDEDVCARAWSQLPLSSGVTDGITLAPSASMYETIRPTEPPQQYIRATTIVEPTPDFVAVAGLGVILVGGMLGLTLGYILK